VVSNWGPFGDNACISADLPTALPTARSPVLARASLARRLSDLPPQSYFVGSAVFHYLGPALAVLLFARVAPLGVAWLRIVSAGVVFAAWRKPWRALPTIDRSTLRLFVGLGLVLAVMNSCFYIAIDRLPLGTVAAIEFLPVILLAALGVRSLRNGLALALAVAGVAILTDIQLIGQPLGVAFAFANAALFAVYIVLAHRVARKSSIGRIDGLAAAMLIASLAITPIAGSSVAPALLDPVAISAGIGVGITSSVIPYVCDQLAMTRLSRATYSLMISLLPATATVVGIVVLAQIPTAHEVVGVALVVLAVAAHRERSDPRPTSTRAGATSNGSEPSGWALDGAERRSITIDMPAAKTPLSKRGQARGRDAPWRQGRVDPRPLPTLDKPVRTTRTASTSTPTEPTQVETGSPEARPRREAEG
jgi:inner membrane transporter RhtA